jgi:hypothetical protein
MPIFFQTLLVYGVTPVNLWVEKGRRGRRGSDKDRDLGEARRLT